MTESALACLAKTDRPVLSLSEQLLRHQLFVVEAKAHAEISDICRGQRDLLGEMRHAAASLFEIERAFKLALSLLSQMSTGQDRCEILEPHRVRDFLAERQSNSTQFRVQTPSFVTLATILSHMLLTYLRLHHKYSFYKEVNFIHAAVALTKLSLVTGDTATLENFI